MIKQLSKWIAKPLQALFGSREKKHNEVPSWSDEAAQAMIDQAPLKTTKLLHWIAGALAVLLVWSAFSKVDEITRGEGRVIPSRQVQVIQSMDGGIVSQILVQEGETVYKGDPLVRIDETRAVSSLRENRSQYLSLLAKQQRLKALAEGRPFMLPDEIRTESPYIYEQERDLYLASRDELASQVAIARDQVTQREKELAEVRARREQAENSYELTNRELIVTRPLRASGAVSEVDLLRLERDAEKLRGERDQARAQIARIQSAIAEANRKIRETELNFSSKIRGELSETTAKLNSITETSVALTDRVSQATLKSPVNGKVSRLFFNTVGGVIQPGKEVLEVVPTDDALVLEAKIQPKDIAFVRILQKASVKLTAYDYTIYGTLDAIVENISANSVIDEEGNVYYVVRVRTLRPGFGKDKPIIPGMVAQVDIITGKKTILSYMLKPILKTVTYAFTER